MTYPLDDAQLAAALDLATSQGYAQQLKDYLAEARRGWFDPTVVSPEQLGAPESAGNTVLDMVGLNACRDLWASGGLSIRLRRSYGQNAQLELVGASGGALNGQRIFGANRHRCGLAMVADGFDSLRFRGTVVAGGALPVTFTAEDFFVTGGSGTGKGLTLHNDATGNDTRALGCRIRGLNVSVGGDGIELGDAARTLIEGNLVASAGGHSIVVDGGPGVMIARNHLAGCGAGKAALRVTRHASLVENTGMDAAQGFHALLGGRSLTSALTTRAGGTTSRVFLATADPGSRGEYDGLELVIAGVGHLIASHTVTGTDSPYVDLVTPRGAVVATGTSYQVRDAESGRSNNGTALDRVFRGEVRGGTIGLWGKVGVKFVWRATAVLEGLEFLPAAGNHDCALYLHQGDGPTGQQVAVRHCTFGAVGGSRAFPQDICQARGGATPAWYGMGLDSDHRGYRDMAGAGTARLATHYGATAAEVQLNGTVPTADPGEGKVWESTPA